MTSLVSKLPLTAAIICGGKSERFGRDKAFAEWRGRRLIDYALALGRALSDEVLLLTGGENRFPDLEVPAHADLYPDSGPMGGIYTALQLARQEWVAVVPVDCPLLTAEIYLCLWEAREAGKPVVALSDRGLEPLVSLWPRSLSTDLREALERRHLSLYRLLETVPAVQVTLKSVMPDFREEYLYNINYPEDLAGLASLNKDISP